MTSIGGLSAWDTSNVTSMNAMFQDCFALTSVGDLSGWNTGNVTDMGWMFYRCLALPTLGNISGWNTSKVTDMTRTFANMGAYIDSISLNLSGWNTSSVTDMTGMFLGSAVTELDVSGWDTSKVTSASNMFNNCYVQKITMGPKFTLVGQLLSNTWYDNTDGTCYTRAELEALVRTDVRTYTTTEPETAT